MNTFFQVKKGVFVKHNLVISLTLFAIIVMHQQVYAVNMQFLKYSPVSNFTDRDWEILKNTGKQVLNENKDGEITFWENPDSDNHGSLKPIATSTKNGQTCRVLEIRNYTINLSGKAVYKFCQQNDGKWKIAGKKN